MLSSRGDIEFGGILIQRREPISQLGLNGGLIEGQPQLSSPFHVCLTQIDRNSRKRTSILIPFRSYGYAMACAGWDASAIKAVSFRLDIGILVE